MNSNWHVSFCNFFLILKKIFKKMSMCQVHIMSRVILFFLIKLIFLFLKKFHVSILYHATCQGQFFIFNLVLIFVIFFQFHPNLFFFFTFIILVLLPIETKFNLYINIIWIFLLKCIFLLNIFNLELELV